MHDIKEFKVHDYRCICLFIEGVNHW